MNIAVRILFGIALAPFVVALTIGMLLTLVATLALDFISPEAKHDAS